MKKPVSIALEFLAQRNPFDVSQAEWVIMLMDFTDIHGEDALIALAGFYIYAIKEMGEKSTHAIKSTFMHDVMGRKDRFMCPRSSAYGEIFRTEFNLAA